jgi:aconitase A
MNDLFKSRDVLKVGNKEYVIFRLDALEKAGLTKLGKLPYSIRVVLEAALRQCNDREITQADVKNISAWGGGGGGAAAPPPPTLSRTAGEGVKGISLPWSSRAA